MFPSLFDSSCRHVWQVFGRNIRISHLAPSQPIREQHSVTWSCVNQSARRSAVTTVAVSVSWETIQILSSLLTTPRDHRCREQLTPEAITDWKHAIQGTQGTLILNSGRNWPGGLDNFFHSQYFCFAGNDVLLLCI